MAGALAEQWGLEFADLERDPPDGGLARPELADLYLVHRILPWRRIGEVVIFATDRPESAAAALSALGEAALGEAGSAVAVAPARLQGGLDIHPAAPGHPAR